MTQKKTNRQRTLRRKNAKHNQQKLSAHPYFRYKDKKKFQDFVIAKTAKPQTLGTSKKTQSNLVTPVKH